MIEFFLFALLLGIVGNILWFSWCFGITPTPTSTNVRKTLVDLFPELKVGEKILELGSGCGKLAFTLADHYPQCSVYAYEISFFPYIVSVGWNFFNQRPNLYFERKDFFSIPFDNASLIFCYLYPEAMTKLKEKFQAELKPGTYVITHTFAVPGWVPLRVIYADDIYKTPVYLYQNSEFGKIE